MASAWKIAVAGIAASQILATPGEAKSDEAYERAVKAVQARMAAIDALGQFSPGRAIVMVRKGEKPRIDAKGTTRIAGGQPVDKDTPFYIASMTKAFVGLLAVRLDADGILPLETTLGETFPTMRVEGVDLNRLTMRDLLSHQAGFRATALNIRTAYTDLVPIDAYPRIVSASGGKIDEAFRYDNLGYLLYAAVLEKRTGRSWRSWIDDKVFDPLGMEHSSARTSDFAEVSYLHMRYADGLKQYSPKPDAIMHAAGGLVISPADMARWLEANAGAPGRIPAREIAAAQTPQVQVEMKEGPIHCTGYTFGWRRCELAGLSFLEHGGGYTGMRTQMAVVPDKGVGFAALFNSDSMTGGLSGRLMMTFLMAYAGKEAEVPPPDAFAASYAKQVAELGANREEGIAKDRADPKWGGWQWKPALAELAPLTGTYSNPAFGTLEIGLEDGKLAGRLNGTPISLEPAKKDLFAAVLSTDYEVETLAFERGPSGRANAVKYLEARFMPQPQTAPSPR